MVAALGASKWLNSDGCLSGWRWVAQSTRRQPGEHPKYPNHCFDMTAPTAPPAEPSAEHAVLHTLAYFAVFSYPLTEDEIWAYAPASPTGRAGDGVDFLLAARKIFRFGPFFQLQDDPSWVPRRLEQNRRADQFLPIARRMARLIGGFPFVRGVFVSGSLSKHCMSADSDIDFFIVTAPERLWLARTLLVFFKKIFLFNSHKYFCVNYFVDTEHLDIEEKNRFTATETVTLLPMYGREEYTAFRQANDWAWQMFPNFPARALDDVPLHTRGFFKKTWEWLLNGRVGEWLDGRSMRLTVGFWRRKFRHFDGDKFDAALKSRRHVSKHHPLHFQEKVLRAWKARLLAEGAPAHSHLGVEG